MTRRLLRALGMTALALAVTALPTTAQASSIGDAAAAVLIEVAVQGSMLAFEAALNAVVPKSKTKPKPALDSPRAPPEDPELRDWIEPQTGTTSRLTTGCEQVIEARLTGTRYLNLLRLSIYNDSNREVDVLARSEVSSSRWLNPNRGLVHLHQDPQVLPHSAAIQGYVLEKSRFRNLQRFTVELDVFRPENSPCKLNVEFSRPPDVPVDQASYIRYSVVDTGTNLGAHVVTFGNVRRTAKQPALSASYYVDVFPSLHHGITLDVGFDGLDGNPYYGGFSLVPGYQYRTFLSQRVKLSFGLGIGPYVFANLAGPAVPAKWSLVAKQRLQLGFTPIRSTRPGGIELGPTLSLSEIAGRPFGPNRLSGGILTVGGMLTVGF